MKDITVIVFTMKGCGFCAEFRELLEENSIDYIDKDIDENEDEYMHFIMITGNSSIPALLIIESEGDNHKPFFYAPDRDYEELTDAINIIKRHIGKD